MHWDEYNPDHQRKLLLLFKYMKKDGFSVFLESRPYPVDIHLSLTHGEDIEILANDEDIKFCIEEKVQFNDITSDLMAYTQEI